LSLELLDLLIKVLATFLQVALNLILDRRALNIKQVLKFISQVLLNLRNLNFVVVCPHLLHCVFNLSLDLVEDFEVSCVLLRFYFVAEVLSFLLVLLVDTLSNEVVLPIDVILEASKLSIDVDS
jgi:hypothetical protein